MSVRSWLRGLMVFGLLGIVLLAVGLLVGSDNKKSDAAPTGSTTTTSTTVDAGKCSNSWARSDQDKTGNRWFANGVPSIASATTPQEASKAAHDWLAGVRTDPVLLEGAAKYVVHEDVKQEELFDSNGCATSTAVDLNGEMEAALALSSFKPDQAPSSGYNSGVDNGQVVGASNSGITGDRKAVLVELPDGTKIWIMARCGNPVTEGTPPVPPGKTELQPPPPSTPPPNNPPPNNPPPQVCQPPAGVPPEKWDFVKCEKKPQSFDEQQNGSPADQPVQDNSVSGVNTGPTPGAPATAPSTPQGPTPQPGTPAPPPNSGGNDSGTGSGSNTPGGSTCDPSGCTGGGSTPGSGTPVTVDDGSHSSDPGGF